MGKGAYMYQVVLPKSIGLSAPKVKLCHNGLWDLSIFWDYSPNKEQYTNMTKKSLHYRIRKRISIQIELRRPNHRRPAGFYE